MLSVNVLPMCSVHTGPTPLLMTPLLMTPLLMTPLLMTPHLMTPHREFSMIYLFVFYVQEYLQRLVAKRLVFAG